MTKSEGLSDRIRNRRIDLGISQAQLARDTGIAAPQLSRYEKGLNEPRPDITARIAKALNVDLDWLITGKGDPSGVTFTKTDSGWNAEVNVDLETHNKLSLLAEKFGVTPDDIAKAIVVNAIDREYEKIKLEESISSLESAINSLNELSLQEKIDANKDNLNRSLANFAISSEELSQRKKEFYDDIEQQSDQIRALLKKAQSLFNELNKTKK